MTLSAVRSREALKSAQPLRLTFGSPHRANDADGIWSGTTDAANMKIDEKSLTS
jgi:hypothetical protein